MKEINQKYKETLFITIAEFAQEKKLGLIDAVVEYCKQNNMEIEEVIPNIDDIGIKLLAEDAIQNRMVRECVARKNDVLHFE